MDALRIEHIATVYERVIRVKPDDPVYLGDCLLFIGEPKYADLSESETIVQDLLDATSGNSGDEEFLDANIVSCAERYGPMDKNELSQHFIDGYGVCQREGLEQWRRAFRNWGLFLRRNVKEGREEALKNPNPGNFWEYKDDFEGQGTVSFKTEHDLAPLAAERTKVQGDLGRYLRFAVEREEVVVRIESLMGRGLLECAFALSGKKVIKRCMKCGCFKDLSYRRERGGRWKYCEDCRGSHRQATFKYKKELIEKLNQDGIVNLAGRREKAKDKEAFDLAIEKVRKDVPYRREGNSLIKNDT
jgi:hypothetical protein